MPSSSILDTQVSFQRAEANLEHLAVWNSPQHVLLRLSEWALVASRAFQRKSAHRSPRMGYVAILEHGDGYAGFQEQRLQFSADESLTGNGGVAAQHSVTLSWAASSSTAVVGYNVYRSTVSGGPYARITSGPDGSMSYTDIAVSAGKSYFYVVTAVEGNGTESTYSNQAMAVIP